MSYQDDFLNFDTWQGLPDLDTLLSEIRLHQDDPESNPEPYVMEETPHVIAYTKALIGALAEARQELALLQQIMDLSARLVTRGLEADGADGDAILQSDYQAMQRWRATYGFPSGKTPTLERLDALLPPKALPAAPKPREL